MSDTAPLPFLSANIRQAIRDLAEEAGFIVTDVPRPADGPAKDEVPQLYRMLQRGIHHGMTMEPGSLVLLHKHEVGAHHALWTPPDPADPATEETDPASDPPPPAPERRRGRGHGTP